MDGALAVAFFLPALVLFNAVLSVLSFSVCLLVSFGPHMGGACADFFASAFQLWRHVLSLAGVPLTPIVPADGSTLVGKWVVATCRTAFVAPAEFVGGIADRHPYFFPACSSVITVWTVCSTYGVGGAIRHGDRGWRFIQPGRGGVLFVCLQSFLWIFFAFGIVLPWTTVEEIGWFLNFEVDAGAAERSQSQAAMLVAGSAMGMLSMSVCTLVLMAYDSDELKFPRSTRKARKELEQFPHAEFMQDKHIYWWLFLVLQATLTSFSFSIAFQLDNNPVKNVMVEAVLLIVITSLSAASVVATNAVGGKWRHGASRFKLLMPLQGGLRFVFLQGLGWTFFSMSTAATVIKLASIVFQYPVDIPVTITAGAGLVAFALIFLSLFWFDPDQVEKRLLLQPAARADSSTSSEDEDEDESGEPKEEESYVVSGKRQSPRIPGAFEYLVAAKTGTKLAKASWIPESELSAAMVASAESQLIHSRKTGNPSPGRSVSPPRRNKPSKDASATQRGSSGQARHPPATSSAKPAAKKDEWEEFEDEKGNVFYIQSSTGKSSRTPPKNLAQLIPRT